MAVPYAGTLKMIRTTKVVRTVDLSKDGPAIMRPTPEAQLQRVARGAR